MKRYVPELNIMDVFVFLLLTGVAYAVIKMGLELDNEHGTRIRHSFNGCKISLKSSAV